MAVLLAVLYTFSHLAADNEITAMRASGLSIYQVLTPVLAWGAFMAAVNYAFVDQVLPRTNAELRSLLIDIGRKKPTFELREQVINEVPPSQYFLRASRIDAATGKMSGVTIYDVGGEASRRIIYADSGSMAYAEGQTDLSLRLYDGSIHQYRPAEPTRFQLTYFAVNDIRVKNVYDQLQRNTSESIRGDREMSTCEMLQVIHEAEREEEDAQHERAKLAERDLRLLLDLPAQPVPPPAPPDSTPHGYCGWLQSLTRTVLPKTAKAQAPAQSAAQQPQVPAQQPQVPAQQPQVPAQQPQVPAQQPQVPAPKHQVPAPKHQVPAPKPHHTTKRPIMRPQLLPGPRVQRPGPAPLKVMPAQPLVTPKLQPPQTPRVRLSTWSEVASAGDRAREADRRADRYAVEVHKKWAISLACVSFVIIGIVMALRFPRAGIGLVIGGGLAVFSIHYVGLTAGESLADRGLLEPWLSMWLPNIVLTILGVLGLIRVSRETGSTRGGDFQEIIDSIRYLLRRLRRIVAR
jgi:lipopolysaccharide export system permease protein